MGENYYTTDKYFLTGRHAEHLRLSRNESKNQKDRFPQALERSATYLMEML